MSSDLSVTEWIVELRDGESYAAQKLWEKYVAQLVRLASKKLGSAPRRVADEEDVAVVAFASFCRGVAEGRFPQLDDRNDLWQVLVILTERKAIDQLRNEMARKRGGGDVLGESAIVGFQTDSSQPAGAMRIADGAISPEFAVRVAEEFERKMACLADKTEREIALAKMAGSTNVEIAQQLGISLRSVERKLSLIRRTWQHDTDESA